MSLNVSCTRLLTRESLFNKILVPIDGSKYAEKALDIAIDLAKKCYASLIIIHVVPKTSTLITGPEAVGSSFLVDLRRQLEKSGQHILDVGAKKAQETGIIINTVLEFGNTTDKILQIADKEKVDLIVIGDRGLGFVTRFFLGSVANKVSQYAKCPVLIVKP